jgi:hypothetical protein
MRTPAVRADRLLPDGTPLHNRLLAALPAGDYARLQKHLQMNTGVTFIRRCREFDFSIEQVRVLVSLLDDPKSCCMDARDVAAKHLDDVQAKMRELKALEPSLVFR